MTSNPSAAWVLIGAISALLVATDCEAEAALPVARAVMTDSSTAPLSSTRRVVITNVMLSFQASAGGDKTNTSGLFAAKTDTSTTLKMPQFDTALLAGIADDVHRELKADLVARGYELVPEEALLASANYAKLVAKAGIANFSKFGNLHGDVMLVGASGLKPYLPYASEVGKFGVVGKRLIDGWVTGFGANSSTEGGPSYTGIGGLYELPGIEIALAKELNAHVLKATYVVTLGSTKAGVDRFASTTHNQHTGSAFAQVGLLAGQSRLAFRTPSANPSGETASRSINDNFGAKSAPAKDGDVVATLAESLVGGTEFFALEAPAVKKGGLLSGLVSGSFGTGADVQFSFTAIITDPAGYRDEVLKLVKSAQLAMLEIVKP